MATGDGVYYITSVAGQVASSEANLGATALTTGTGKAFFYATENLNIIEYGVNIQTNTSANALVLTLTTAPKFGGSYTAPTVASGVVITCTGPSAGLTAGQCLRKNVGNISVSRGQIIRLDATTGVAAGSGIAFLVCTNGGDSLQATNDVLSTT